MDSDYHITGTGVDFDVDGFVCVDINKKLGMYTYLLITWSTNPANLYQQLQSCCMSYTEITFHIWKCTRLSDRMLFSQGFFWKGTSRPNV